MDTNKEYAYKGMLMNGFLMALIAVGILVLAAVSAGSPVVDDGFRPLLVGGLLVLFCVAVPGFFTQQPNQARVMIFFGKYKGTFSGTGFYWANPFMKRTRISRRIHNIDVEPIKVNDKVGNPVMIGMVLVWRVKDTYRAVFDVDTISDTTFTEKGVSIGQQNRNLALENFVRIQSDAALREVTGRFAYDDTDSKENETTLRSGGDEINELLDHKINERVSMAGIEVVEARLNYLAYAPEIAAVMLRRQQASAIITAREKIVEGAVSMVKMALQQLSDEQIVELDEERKAAMVSNLLVVLCADEPAQPVLNTGSLYQ